MSTPKVTIVIPTYNCTRWVTLTLESVLRQTYPLDDVELVLVDDVSTDETVDVVTSFLSDKPVAHRLLRRTTNGGVSPARNDGWRAARGEWIQLLDADDLLEPHKLKCQMDAALAGPPDLAVVYTNWQALTLQGDEWAASGPINAACVDDDPVIRILEEQSFGYVGPSLVRRSFIDRVGGFNDRPNLGEDVDLMLRIAMAGGRFRQAHSSTAAFLYRQTPNSLWQKSAKSLIAMRSLLETWHGADVFLRRQSPNGALSARARRALARRYLHSVDYYLENDPASFQDLIGWVRALDVSYLPESRVGMKIFSKALGLERALKTRNALRKLKSRLTKQPMSG